MYRTRWLIFVSAVFFFMILTGYSQAQDNDFDRAEIDRLQKEIKKLNSQMSDQQIELKLMKQLIGTGEIDDIEIKDVANEKIEKRFEDQDEEIKSLKENLAFVYKQTIKDSGIIEQYKLENEIYFRTSYFDMNRENNFTGDSSYENAVVNAFDLKFSAQPLDEVQFNATFSMYKLWGAWNSPESIRSSDFTYSSTPSDAGVKVKKAYVDYRPEWLKGRLSMTFGRLPTVDGYLTKYRYNRPSQSSYPDLAFNAESDGVAFTVYFKSALFNSLNLVYARSEDDTDMNPFETDPLGLEDINFYAAQLNTTLPFLDDAAFSVQWLRVDDIRVSGDDVIRDLARFYMPQVANTIVFPETLGNINKYSVQLDKEKVFGHPIDIFVSAAWSDPEPNKEQILVNGKPLDPAILPPEIAPYTKYLYLTSADNQQSDTGWAVYAGARYHFNSKQFKHPKIGFEYFKSSEYWVGLNVAGLDPYQKLNTRGKVWEVYWIQPLVQPLLQCRFGYQNVEREYSSTLFGGLYGVPEEVDQEDSLAYVSMEFMF